MVLVGKDTTLEATLLLQGHIHHHLVHTHRKGILLRGILKAMAILHQDIHQLDTRHQDIPQLDIRLLDIHQLGILVHQLHNTEDMDPATRGHCWPVEQQQQQLPMACTSCHMGMGIRGMECIPKDLATMESSSTTSTTASSSMGNLEGSMACSGASTSFSRSGSDARYPSDAWFGNDGCLSIRFIVGDCCALNLFSWDI